MTLRINRYPIFWVWTIAGKCLPKTQGKFHEGLSRVCLDQTWIRNAAMNFLFITDLTALEKESGPRGYRKVLMESGRMGRRIYLAAQGLGCCGVGALYDREARSLMGLDPETALFYLISTGPVKRSF
ncbi:nitroreductase family protein [Desulfospira joergensenii]|uniref:nitroreductase family protein n=1 Tax=Desulfospira joergensenii TaxID=53329 RepID=UPI000525A978|nr:nitroreductase family protein [Desulfospira joergensenii]